MITISDGILTIPESERFVGFSGDNLHTQKKFFIRSCTQSGWLYRLYLTFDDGRHNFFVLPSTTTSEGTFLIWDIEESHILKSGIIKAQIKAFSDNKEVYHTTSDVFFAGETSEEDKEFKNSNSEFLHFEKTLNELYGKMENASAKMPYVGTNGNWFTYDVQKGNYVDSGISSLVALGDGTIPPSKLDRGYWEKKINVEQITGAEALLNAIGCSNDGGSIALVNLKIYVASYDTTINGLCYAIGVKFPTGETIYIINLTDGSMWKINRYNEGDNIVPLYRFEYIRLGVPDGTITPLKLDRTYLEKCCTSLGQQLNSFEDLYAKIGYISMSGKIGIVKLYISDSENTTIKDTGYISGEFLAVGSPTHTSGYIYLLNLANGENWTVCHNFDSDTYYAYKVDTLTPRVEYLENSAKFTVVGTFHLVSEIQKYYFSKNRVYQFDADAQVAELVGKGYCYARYYEIIDSETDVVTDKMLEVFNSSTLKVYALNITKGTAELINEAKSEDGYTPVKGVDYYTDEDKAEFESYITEELAKRGQLKPEFANSISECTDTSKLYVLPDGYIYAYMKTTSGGIAYTNLLPLATDTDRVTVFNDKGYKEDTRLSSSSGSTSDATGVISTGFIPAVAGDLLYFENISWSGLSQKCYILAFNSSNEVTGKLEIQGTTASPAPTSPVTLDSATFGADFNAIRISASDISTDTVITINEEIKESVVEGYGWVNTGHAFVPADYENRILKVEEEVQTLKTADNSSFIPLVKFDYDHNLTDVSAMVSGFQVSSHDLRKQKTLPTVYSLFDELVLAYPDYVSKEDAADLVGLTYPEYANGITTADTYEVTPAYKTYMYKLSYSNAYSGNEGRHKHKKMLLIGGLDGSEYVPPYNLYILAKRLCEDFLNDSNLFKLRNSFDIYIVPCLNGYGLYHGTKYNANGVAITRNMPTKAWVEADEGDPNYYTGSVAGSEFETQLVMKLTEYISPDVAIDHHSYGYLPTQFYSELPREDFARLSYQSLVDCSLAFAKNLPRYFGTSFKLYQDREGATSAPAQVANVRGTQTWWDEYGVAFSGLIEASVSINYLNGQPAGEGQDLYGNDTFSVAEYTLRNQLLRYCEFVLNEK